MPATALVDDVLERGFQLAYFIHGDRPTAIAVVTDAAERLDVAMAAQDKRLYYHPKIHVTKVSLNRLHLFQRLIYIASEKYEREAESGNGQHLDQSAMLVRFVKHLVRITLRRNSFYVALGVSRLLHNYTTVEAMEMYDALHDPPQGRDDCYYRSRKSILMREMADRFGGALRICRAAHGEERFAAVRFPSRYLDIAKHSLEMFSPWDTPCLNGRRPHAASRAAGDLEDEVELQRMHAILHPSCFDSLIRSLGLNPPDERLDLPAFAVVGDHGSSDEDGGAPPRLLPPDLREIRARLAGGASRRKQMSTEILRIVGDGIDRARLELRQGANAHFEIAHGAEVIEVRSGYGQSESVVALFLLPYRGERLISCHAARTLESGDRLRLRVTATDSGASVDVECDRVRALRFLRSLSLRWLSERQRVLASLAGTATLAAVLAWLFIPIRTPSTAPVLRATETKPAAPSQAVETVDDDKTRAPHLGATSTASDEAIYVEVRGNSEGARAMREVLRDRIRIVSPEKASRALKLLVQEQSPDGTLTISAALVDVEGMVLWPQDHARRIYRGQPAAIAQQIVEDLSAARR